MSNEPILALAATPRPWAQRLHRHVTEHGGARIRATVLTPSEALQERYEVLLADDRTSFLSQRLIQRLHDDGKLVLGLYDADDPRGKTDLASWGADQTLSSDADPELLVATAARLPRRLVSAEPLVTPPMPTPPVSSSGVGARVIAITGTRGAGRSEVALALGAALTSGGSRVLVAELDEHNACFAPRLGLPPYPNLRAALDWSRRNGNAPAAAVQRVEAGLGVLVAGPAPSRLAPPPPDDLATLVSDLAASTSWLILDVGDARAWGEGRDAHHVVVGQASPVGAVRLTDLLAGAATPMHVVLNRAPASAYRRWEFLEELQRTHNPRSITTVPDDRHVFDAAWRGRPATTGSFGKAIRRLATTLLDEVI